MAQMTQTSIIKQMENTLQHLETFLPLANVHMVDYFTKNVYYDFIPKDIRTEVNDFGFTNAINAIYRKQTNHLPCLNKYINKCTELTLKNTPICLSLEEFKTKLADLGCQEISNQKLEIFMKPKKSHEVEMLSGIAAAIKEVAKTSHLIDIGDGKGYLSSMLALHYKIPILGVDASEINTNGAVDRAKKLSKIWNSIVPNIKSRETSIHLYKQITRFVDENVDFNELVYNIFLEKPQSLGLVGLHTCGNLAPTSLRIFNKSKHIKTICNIGCCYHFLSEEFEPKDLDNPYQDTSQIGFPMSQFLKNKKFAIGRAARMVSAQSVDRILNKKEGINKAMFHRALFEIIIKKALKENNIKIQNTHVGRFRKEIPTFLEYTKKASDRINFPLAISDKDVNVLCSLYQNRKDEMHFFYLVRCMLSQVVETLILLDRLLFLCENGHTNSFLVHFFEPVVSPRCYGIVSLKK